MNILIIEDNVWTAVLNELNSYNTISYSVDIIVSEVVWEPCYNNNIIYNTIASHISESIKNEL